jgi:hypothetical protein
MHGEVTIKIVADLLRISRISGMGQNFDDLIMKRLLRLKIFGREGANGYLCRPKNLYNSGNLSELKAAFV